jgi:hypothetical protein
MKDIVQLFGHMNKLGYIVMIELKVFLGKKVLDVLQATGKHVVHPNHMIIPLQEPIAKMGAEETCCTGNKNFSG